MIITLIAIGRLKAGPERDLAARYMDRARKQGRALALEVAEVIELPEARGSDAARRKREEAEAIDARLPGGAEVIALDERGRQMGSEAFAAHLAERRDGGLRHLVIVIGGPDGLDTRFRERSSMAVALGRMTWPHQIARILAAEQIYRTTTIIAGHPYHRA